MNFDTEKMLQLVLCLRSVKNARIIIGMKGTKTTLGCIKEKIIASKQKKNCEMGAMSFAKNEKLFSQTD